MLARRPHESPDDDQLDRAFRALADPTRRALLDQLAAGEATVTVLAAPHAMSLPAISKHLRVLEAAGLVRRRIEGRQHFLRLESGPIDDATAWLTRQQAFWAGTLDALAAFVESPPESAS